MNLIPKIAEMLGVEIGEEFEANGKTVKFTEDGLIRYNKDGIGREWWSNAECTLIGLINGTYEVKKPPFEPKDGEKYWTVYWKGIVDMPCAVYETWRGDSCDFANKVSGNCFRTEAEAERHKYEIYEKLTGKKWEE